MKLHENYDIFEATILRTSEYLNIPELFIEKDYWICFILKRLAQSKYKDSVVFKGGTSLSKVFNAINRFSEDIDLNVLGEFSSDNQIKSTVRNIEKYLINAPLLEVKNGSNPKNKKSKIRKSEISYPKIGTQQNSTNILKDKLVLEINAYSQPVPYSKFEIIPYVYNFLDFNGHEGHKIIDKYELSPFEINVMTLERTFCEKISSIARASFENNNELKLKIRHIYDIHCLMNLKNIVKLLNNIDDFAYFLKLVKKADNNIVINNEKFQEWLSKPYYEAPVFKDPEVILEFQNYYKSTFSGLVFGEELPSLRELSDSLRFVSSKMSEVL